MPYQIPSNSQEAAVSKTLYKCHLRVNVHTHPTKLKPMMTKWSSVKKTSKSFNHTIVQSYGIR